MANKRIIEQTASTTISNDDWLIKDSATGGTTKILASVLRTLLGGDNFASTYDSSLTYYAGNMCIYNGILYKCKAFSGTTGTFDSSKWTQVTITDYASKLLASDWRATSSYVMDDLVSYRGNIYRCASDSATVGTFVHTEWITANWDSIKIVLLRNNIAKEYDGSEIYNKGDLVFESPYYLCVCKENGVTGTFDTSKWITDGTISDALELVDEQIIENIAGEYDSEVEYSKDALCFKDGVLYIANADTTGTWDSTKWQATTIAEIIATIDLSAEAISYDNTSSGLEAENVQDAIGETITKLSAVGSASGAIATFDDGSDLPMPSLKVAIEPQQDLHGYDHPWAGGSGKNKLPLTVDGIKSANSGATWSGNSTTINNVTFTIQTDSDGNVKGINVNGTARGDSPSLYLCKNVTLSNDTYTLNGCPTNGSLQSYVLFVDYSSGGNIPDYGSGASLPINNVTISARIRVQNGYNVQNLVFKPMIRLSSVTDATFAPYSNICPISGWSEANVTRTGKNLLDTSNPQYIQYNASGDKRYGYELKVVGTVTASCKAVTSGYIFAKKVSASGEYGDVEYLLQNTTANDVTFNVNEGETLKIYSNISAQDTVVIFNTDEVQVEVGNQATTYEPYAGTTYTIDLDGTRYGGELDVVSGVLTVDRECVTYDGSENWILYGSGSASAFAMVVDSTQYNMNVDTTPITNSLKSVPRSATWGDYADFVSYNSIRQIVCGINTITTPEAWKTYLASNNLQVMYELATPLTIQLTPTQVKSLLGTNNVWADTGDVNEAVYTRDLNTTVNDIISRIEALENA